VGQRIVTGIIAGSVFLTMLLLGGYWFTGLIYMMAIVALDEYLRMMHLRTSKSLWVVGLIGLLAMISPWDIQLMTDYFPIESLIWMLLFVLFILTVITNNKIMIDQMALVFLGIIYIGFGFHFIVETRNMEPFGLFYTTLIMVCVIVTDTGAYFSGYLFGKHKLAPHISPKKTMEGALGGLLLSIFAAFLFHLYDQELLSLVESLILGFVIGVVGQFGDLIQSAYKRVKGVKDSGKLLPGHGGVLDRVDSWLIVFPFVHLLLLIPK
jgi:phosphatidate cytidylyltransferase